MRGARGEGCYTVTTTKDLDERKAYQTQIAEGCPGKHARVESNTLYGQALLSQGESQLFVVNSRTHTKSTGRCVVFDNQEVIGMLVGIEYVQILERCRNGTNRGQR